MKRESVKSWMKHTHTPRVRNKKEVNMITDSFDNSDVFIGLAMHNQTETWAVQFAYTFKEEADGAEA